MIGIWLDLPAPATFATLAVAYTASGLVIAAAIFHPRTFPFVRSFAGITPSFFTSVSVLFALLAGFLASEVGERNRQAVRIVQTEAGELRNLYTLSIASASDMENIRSALRTYVQTVVLREWPAMTDHSESKVAARAYDSLLRDVSDPAIAREAGSAVHSALLTAALRAGTARSERLSLASDHSNEIKWISVLVLGVLAQLAIAVVHLERWRPHILGLAVFTLAATTALSFIAIQDQPFDGTVTPAPLEELLRLNITPGLTPG